MTRPRRCGFATTAILLVCLASRADAQVSKLVYEDLKSVIEDLITGEIAATTATELVCRAGHVELPSPTQADKQRPDVIEIGKKHYQLAALQHFPSTLTQVYRRQFGGLSSTIRAESAALGAYLLYQALRAQIGAPAAPAPSASLQARRTLLAATTTKIVGGVIAEDTLFSDLGETCRTRVRSKLDEGLAVTVSPIEKACAGSSSTEDRLACSLARTLQAAVLDGDEAAGHLEEAASIVVAAALEKTLRSAGLTISDASAFEEQVRTYLASVIATPENFKQQSTAFLAEVIANVVTSSQTDVDARIREITGHLQPLEMTVRRVAATWRRVADAARRRDIATMLEALLAEKQSFQALCTLTGDPGPCAYLDKVTKVLGPGSRWMALLRVASSGNVRELARATLESLLPRKQASTCADLEVCRGDVYQRFAVSVVYYAIDISEERTPSDATRAAFRAAALDLIRGVWVAGYDRANWTPRSIFYPNLALRAAWSAGHLGQDGESLRYLATASWITVRVPVYYTSRVYLAGHVSLADPIAPLAELALRTNDVTYHDSKKLALNLFSPRFDVAIGLPALSRHLTLNAGATLHLTAPYADPDGSFRYKVYGEDDATRLSQGLQLSVAINYVP